MTTKMERLATQQPVIAVLGASGFVGRNLLPILSQKGYRIRAGVRNPHLCGHLEVNGYVGQIELIRIAAHDDASLHRLIEGADYIINLVGILFEKGKQNFTSLHHELMTKIAVIAKKNNVKRIVHLSSIGADHESLSHYAISKAEGEKTLLKHFPDCTILRPSLIFGPEDNFFNRFAAQARIAPFIPLIDGGHTLFQPIYVVDLCRAICKAITHKKAKNTIYEIGGPHVYSFRELIQFILKWTMRKCLLVYTPSSLMHMPAFFLEYLPNPPITRDQLTLLRHNNIVSEKAINEERTIKTLDIEPTSIDMIVPQYLKPYRKGGNLKN